MSNNYRKVFLSYAREDKESAEKIKQFLEKYNLEVWFDKKSLDGGEEWVEEVKKEINSSHFFVVLLSEKSINKKKGHIQTEIKQALNRRKKRENNFLIIPVRLEECEPAQLEFKDINWIDLFTSWEDGCNKLIRALNISTSQHKNLEIIGFDLGHGETAIAKTSLYTSTKELKFNTTEPKSIEIINGKPSIITAVAMKNGNTIIGDDAYDSKDVANLHILFKSYHLEDPKVREPIQSFVRKCLDILRQNERIKLDENTYFFVGSPSDWTENDRKKYEEVLKYAGMTNVTVQPESRAAFLEAKESGDLSEVYLQDDSVLIIDIGSSTTDFTIVKNSEEKPLDFGNKKLGGGLLDIAIFERTLRSYPEEKRNSFYEIFQEKSELKAQCLLKCREIKEKYFSKSNEDDWIDKPVTCDPKEVKEDLYFSVKLYKKDMEEIRNSPIPELNDRSWVQSFRDQLEKYQRSSNYQIPKLVLLTGGASRMGFISSTCKDVFPPETKIRVGLEPSLTIAKGLAYIGRIDLKVQSFIQEVEEFIASNSLRSQINNKFQELSQDLSKTTFDIFSEVVKNNLKKWQKGEIQLISELENSIAKDAEIYLKSKKCLEKFDKEIENWLKDLSLDIQKETQNTCERYVIPEATFKLEVTEKSVADSNMSRYFGAEDMVERKVWTMGSGIVGAILGGMVATFFTISNIFYWGVLEITTGGVTGWIALLAIGLFGGLFGLSKIEPLSERATNIIKSTEIPKILRLLSDTQIDKIIKQARPEFEKNLIVQFEKQSETNLNELIEAIKKDLLYCAEKARILIK